jgi:hypothetical protein
VTVIASSGTAVTLLAQFESDGIATDPELPLLLSVLPAAGGAAVVEAVEPTRITAGIFSYTWTPPAVTSVTDYVAMWDPAGDDIAAVETVRVFPASASVWATPEQVKAVTGKEIGTDTIAVASSIIDTFAGTDPEMPADAISGVDRRHLRRATAWQSLWVANKPGLIEERENASTVTSDGQSVTREDRADVILHPLARRELVSLSWVGTRTAFVPPMMLAAQRNNFLNERSDPAWFGGEGALP